MLKQKNTGLQGNIGITTAMDYFTRNGYNISIPLTDSQTYDLLIEKFGSILKIQVKTTYYRNKKGYFEPNIRNLDRKSVNYLFILTEENDKYLIPIVGNKIIPNQQKFSLTKKYNLYKL